LLFVYYLFAANICPVIIDAFVAAVNFEANVRVINYANKTVV